MKILTAIALTLALTVSVAHAQQATPQSPSVGQHSAKKAMLTYKQAYAKAQSGDKPLLVLVTADWCPPCRVMKSTTIPELMQKKALSKFHFAMVDFDKESDIANEVIKGGEVRLPQLVMFEKSDGKWLRRRLKGIQTAQTVESFVAQSNAVRLASSTQEKVEKK